MNYLLLQGDVARIPLPDKSVDLVFGSPPYVDARLYLEDGRDLGIARDCAEWVEWMLGVTKEALRVTRNCVIWIAAGDTENRTYRPACEGLMWEWWKRGGSAYRPCYWRRNGIPGSGGDQWFRADAEYAMCFKPHGPLAWSNNKAMGQKPKFKPGGNPSYRRADGKRVCEIKNRHGEWGDCHQVYVEPDIANPGNLIDTGAGGSANLGSPHGHLSEAPFPEALAEFFIRSLCPPGGIVLDPFSGSGTTVSVALQHGRQGIGMDLRRSQAKIARQRVERPHAPVRKDKTGDYPLFARTGS